VSTQAPQIALATHHFPERYLLAFATQAEVLHHVRTQALEEEHGRLQEILDFWAGLQPRVADLVKKEAGIADSTVLEPIGEEDKSLLDEFAADALFQKTFANLPDSRRSVRKPIVTRFNRVCQV
jgi:hypothetical protein